MVNGGKALTKAQLRAFVEETKLPGEKKRAVLGTVSADATAKVRHLTGISVSTIILDSAVEGVHKKEDGFISLVTAYRNKKMRRGPDGMPATNPGANVRNDSPLLLLLHENTEMSRARKSSTAVF